METAKQAFNYVAESVQGAASGVSKETKQGDRQERQRSMLALGALGDKIDEFSPQQEGRGSQAHCRKTIR
ncbi:hypothetical protein Trco_004820 [Trichoderma cornu-damae]|uniref:Uncharacterized protein n=1 Tax=Trichoderma cornu-damae TaxID=654480 RepID=A0A9P8QNL3_9HYPO|nr:hypothetical protein Trco_004820 [Trichoderma cornu-damae]